MVTTTTAGVLLWKIVVAAAILLVGAAAGSWLAGAAGLALERSGLDPAIRRGLSRAVRPLVMLVATVAAIETLDVDLAIVAAMAGAATLAVGLALRGPLSSLASGAVLLTLRPFREGDQVGIAGEHGRVLEQGSFAVVLERADGTVVTVANDVVVAGPIHNHSRRGTRRVTVTLDLPRDVDPIAIRARLLALVAADARILATPEPVVRVAGIGHDTVRFSIEAWTLSAAHDDVAAGLDEAILAARTSPAETASDRSVAS